MPNFRVYLLDFDGTLAATRPAGIECLSRTLREYGATVLEERISATIGRGELLESTIARLMPTLPAADILEMATRYREHYPDIDLEMTSLFDDVHETLDALRRAGSEIVVLSNKSRVALEDTLARFDLLDKASAVLAADPGMPVKPDPEAFHRRVRPLFDGVSPADFIMVGDTAADIAFAQAAGIASCWARYGYGDAGRCLAMNPDFVIGGLPELLSPAIAPR